MGRLPQLKGRAESSIEISIATPDDLKKAIYERYQIDYDPCPLWGHLEGPDALDRNIPWGKRNYVNPPYTKSGIKAFVERAVEEMRLGNNSYFLVPFRAALKYYQYAMANCTGVVVFGQNVRFKGYKSPFPQQLVLLEFEADKPLRFRYNTLGDYGVWEVQ